MLALRERKRGALSTGSSEMEVESADGLRQQNPTHSDNKFCDCKLPGVSEASEKEKGHLPESFENHLTNWRFISTRSLEGSRLTSNGWPRNCVKRKNNLIGWGINC